MGHSKLKVKHQKCQSIKRTCHSSTRSSHSALLRREWGQEEKSMGSSLDLSGSPVWECNISVGVKKTGDTKPGFQSLASCQLCDIEKVSYPLVSQFFHL